MKAKEYYEQHISEIEENKGDDEKLWEIAKGIFNEFQLEFNRLFETRHISTMNAAASLVIEQDRKWNALGRMIEEKVGIPVLKHNGFRNMKAVQVPELKEIFVARGLMKEDVETGGLDIQGEPEKQN